MYDSEIFNDMLLRPLCFASKDDGCVMSGAAPATRHKYIRMRLAARTPPSPQIVARHFVAAAVVLRMAKCRLAFWEQRSLAFVFCKVLCKFVQSSLLDFGRYRHCVSCFGLRRYANLRPKACLNLEQMVPKSKKNHKNRILGASGGLWGASRLQERCQAPPSDMKMSSFFEKVGICGAILAPAGSKEGFKNHHFLNNFQENQKNEVQKRHRKTCEILIEIWCQNGGLWSPKKAIFHYTCCKIWIFGVLEIWWKKGAKRGPKMTSKSTFGRSWVGFLRFWEAFGRGDFLMNFWSAKSWPKIQKLAAVGGKRCCTPVL